MTAVSLDNRRPISRSTEPRALARANDAARPTSFGHAGWPMSFGHGGHDDMRSVSQPIWSAPQTPQNAEMLSATIIASPTSRGGVPPTPPPRRSMSRTYVGSSHLSARAVLRAARRSCFARSPLATIVAAVAAVCCPADMVRGEEFPLYVGRRICLQCHAAGQPAGACTLEEIPEHDVSYEALSKPEAEHIAALGGVATEPRKSRICLACHATAADEGPRWTAETFDFTDGVQCEACHRAGSFHVDAYRSSEKSVSKEARPEPAPRAKGGVLGEVLHERRIQTGRSGSARHRLLQASGEARPTLIRRSNREADCKECHIERPSHKAVLELGYRRPAADRLYKTPVNLAISPEGDLLYVACEHSDSLIVVDPAARRVVDEISVGLRPHDVAVSPDGTRVYVTNRMSGTVSVIDASSRRVIAEVEVGDEPHGVLPNSTGELLFVLNTGQDSISVIDTETLKETKRLAAGAGPWSLALGDRHLAGHPDAESLCITNVRPMTVLFRDPFYSELTVADPTRAVVTDRPSATGANMLLGIDFVPDPPVALFTMMRTKNLVPLTGLRQGWAITNGLGIAWQSGRIDQVLLDEPNNFFPDATDVAVSPDGRYALVTSGGADQVAVVDVGELLATVTEASDRERREVLPNHLGKSSRFVVKRIAVGTNPRGILFAPDGRYAYVANALDDSITIIEARREPAKRAKGGVFPPSPSPSPPPPPDFPAIGEIDLGGPGEITQIRRGERLFHSAANAFGRQFSCRSCHPDGHTNGLTFDIEEDGAGKQGIGMHPVDNRTLRGIFDTPPFKWEGQNPSLERQCGARLAVFFTRLDPFTPEELAALVRYECTIERSPNRHRSPEGLTLSQRRGKAVFERTHKNNGYPLLPEERCVACHNTVYKTTRTLSAVGTTLFFDAPAGIEIRDLHNVGEYGELGIFLFADTGIANKAFDVPHLINIYNSPPYLHNGVAPTLEEIWTRFNMIDRHGHTADLTRQQFNDLIAYVKAL